MSDTPELTPSTPLPEAPVASGGAVARPERRSASNRGSGRRGERSSGLWSGRGPLIAAVVAGIVVVLVLLEVGLTWGRILPGVTVGGVAVGGMTPIGARTALDAVFTATKDRKVTVTWGSQHLDLTSVDVGAQIDTSGSVAAALAVGRSGGILAITGDRVRSTFGGVAIAPAGQLDASASAGVFDTMDAASGEPAVDASVTVNGLDVSVSPSRSGIALDRPAMSRAIIVALVKHTARIDAITKAVAPAVTDAGAAEAKRQAIALASGPVTVAFQGKSVLVPRDTVAHWIVLTAETTGVVKASFDATRMAPAVASLTVGKVRLAKDARFAASNSSVRIVPSQAGTGPDLHALSADLVTACLATGPRTATLVLTVSQPKLTTAAAREMGITERISTYTTRYATKIKERTSNIHLLASAINGKMIAPGAVFSFNGAAGQRTAAKGYQEAPAIVNGRLEPQLGGGVCQVGTTIFNAVFFSGLPVVERRNHSFYISHYPTGRDATVSWGGPDFKFRNETEHWLLVRASTTSNTLTVALYGTDPGYDVHYTTSAFSNIIKFKSVETRDPKLLKGVRVVEDGGVNGCTVVVERTVYKGGAVVRTDTFVSHYSPKTEFVRVGTKASTSPTTTPTP